MGKMTALQEESPSPGSLPSTDVLHEAPGVGAAGRNKPSACMADHDSRICINRLSYRASFHPPAQPGSQHGKNGTVFAHTSVSPQHSCQRLKVTEGASWRRHPGAMLQQQAGTTQSVLFPAARCVRRTARSRFNSWIKQFSRLFPSFHGPPALGRSLQHLPFQSLASPTQPVP